MENNCPGIEPQPIVSNLDGKLSQAPLPLAIRCAIFNKMWNLNWTEMECCSSEDELAAYFRYYEAQCVGLTRGRGCFVVQNHKHLLKIVGYIQNPNVSYDSIVNLVRLDHPGVDDSLISVSIFIAARIWLMLEIGEIKYSVTPGQRPILWQSGTLKQRVRDHFKPSSDSTDMIKLPKTFNAMQLNKVSGIKIVWTNNLADHLRMRDDDTKVTIFHQASFLRRHRDGKFGIIGDDLIKETLKTLALLLPESDKSIKRWFVNKKSKHFLDPTARECGNLNAEQRKINNFKYWRERLIILKTVFDESEPKSLKQWWNDRRFGERWYTFWIAATVILLTLFFGLVQSIEGAIQVFKAYHP